jgi:hypothetical protein
VVCMAVKSTEADVDMRVSQVAGLMVCGYSRTDICEYARKEWGVSASQADRYAQKARESIKEQYKNDLEDRAALSDARHESLYKAAVEAGDYALAERILKDIDDTQGLKGGAAYQQVTDEPNDEDFWNAMSAYGSAINSTCSPEQVTAIVQKANALGAFFNIRNTPKAHPIDPNVERVLNQAAIDMRELGHTRTREELIADGVITQEMLNNSLPPGV